MKLVFSLPMALLIYLLRGLYLQKNPNSTTEYWGIYADGHATFANGNVKFMANGSAEYAGKITSTSGKNRRLEFGAKPIAWWSNYIRFSKWLYRGL